MNVIATIILGFIQGVGEFLPISSSAHLIIFRDVFGIGSTVSKDMALSFDIALHLGTLLAIGIFFFKDFINMISKGLTKGVKDKEGKILWYLIAATIPGGLVGVLFEEKIEELIRTNYILIAISLIVMGVIIYLVDKNMKEEKSLAKVTLKDAIIVGVSQAFALIPGFSRSGTTITTARLLKLDRTAAAKFSFYLSAPIVLGAVVVQIFKKSTWTIIIANMGTFVLGILISFIVGLLCIKFLLEFIKKHDFKVFMIYRILLAIIVILYVTLN